MPTYLATPPNIAPGTLSTWTDVGITAEVGASTTNVKVAHLRIVNSSVTDHAYNVRANTSADDRTTQTIAAHTQHERWVGVDSGDVFEAWRASADVEMYLVSYFVTGEADFLVDAVNVTPAGGAWNDVDVSALTSGVAKAACLEISNGAPSDRKYSIRMNGSTDDRSGRNCQTGHRLGAWAPCDGAEIFEMKNDSGIAVWFSCYLLTNVVFQVNATDVSETSFNVYLDRDFTALAPADANGVFLHFYPSISTPTMWGARADGGTFDKYEDSDLHVFVQVPTVARVAEIKIEAAHQDSFFHGYSLPSAVSDSAALTGLEGIGSPGTVTALANVTIAITSIAATSAVGTVATTRADDAALVGVVATSGLGALVTGGDVAEALVGVSASGGVGSIDVIAGQVADLVGVEGIGAAGVVDVTPAASTGVELVGVEGIGATEDFGFGFRIINPIQGEGHTSHVPRTTNVDVYERQARP